jgi:hypothetical protein
MVQSKAATIEDYLEQLPEERRKVVSDVRKIVLENLPDGYQETLSWGMISYEIPLEEYPDTYNGKPLGYAALAAQKNHYALYLMNTYQDAELYQWLSDSFQEAGKKLDMGKSCLRFKRLDDLPLDIIGEVIAKTPPRRLIELYEESRKK